MDIDRENIKLEAEGAPAGAVVGGTVVAVRFQPVGKIYYFLAAPELALQAREWVVVETMHGLQVGQVVTVNLPPTCATCGEETLRPIVRRASALDMARHQHLRERGERAVEAVAEEIKALGLKEIKAVQVEFTLDGEKAVVFCVGTLSGNDQNALRRRLAPRLRCHVDLRVVGPRDHAKMLGGYGVCGEPRCCARFLSDFHTVSIRMAKDQSISMAPTDITGMCGRLRCCLAYEHQVYLDSAKDFPKRKTRVRTSEGIGRVIDWDALKAELIVEIPPDGPRRERKHYRFPLTEVEVLSAEPEEPTEEDSEPASE